MSRQKLNRVAKKVAGGEPRIRIAWDFYPEEALRQLCQSNNWKNRLKMMINAHDFKMGKDYVEFKFSGNSSVNKFKIQYDALWDTYNIYFMRNSSMVKKFTNVYADDLTDLFEKNTGLYLSL